MNSPISALSQEADASAPIRVLIAEDERHLGAILEQFMSARGFSVRTVRDGRSALEALRAETFDVALLDVVMPEIDGLEVLRLVRERPLPPEIIVITGNGTIETTLAALKLGAYDVLSKPYRMAEIEVLVRRAWEKRMLSRDNQFLQARLRTMMPRPVFLTQYAPLSAVLAMVKHIGPSGSPVLVTGEPGTGKGLLAQVLHAQGRAPDAPFVRCTCMASSGTELEAALFGLEPPNESDGARFAVGLLEMAAGGTLYLDNIDLLEPRLQDRLCEALEAGSFVRVGGSQRMAVNLRVIASTSVDLDRLVQDGTFRDDLRHRINAARISLPPLRDRVVDIPLLARHFLTRGMRARALGGPRLSDDAVAVLERYRWPGNVSELRNVMERASLLATDGVVNALDLPFGSEAGIGGSAAAVVAATEFAGPAGPQGPTVAAIPGATSAPVIAAAMSGTTVTLAELERRHIRDVLERCAWHQGHAAESLGISPKTLYRKIREYGFRRPGARGVPL